MNKKVIVRIALFFCFINLVIVLNLKTYFKVLSICFNRDVSLSAILYVLISSIIALISFLIFKVVKLLIKNEKDEIKGIKLKLEDGTFGTANWMDNEDIMKVLGVVDYEEYRTKSKP